MGQSAKAKTVRKPTRHKRFLPRFVRILRAHLPEISDRYHVKSLGVLGSYLRGEQRAQSDLDVLVEFEKDQDTLHNEVELDQYLKDLLGVKVDLIPNKSLKPYIGKRILREVVWLQKDGAATGARMPRPKPNGKRSGAMSEPKREYMDFLNDMVEAMDDAMSFVKGFELEQVFENREKVFALMTAVQIIGEATKQIPPEVRKRYPDVPWTDIARMRDKLAHGYFSIDRQKLWETVTIDIPRDRPLVAHVLEEEKRRRANSEDEKKH